MSFPGPGTPDDRADRSEARPRARLRLSRCMTRSGRRNFPEIEAEPLQIEGSPLLNARTPARHRRENWDAGPYPPPRKGCFSPRQVSRTDKYGVPPPGDASTTSMGRPAHLVLPACSRLILRTTRRRLKWNAVMMGFEALAIPIIARIAVDFVWVSLALQPIYALVRHH